MFDSRIAPILRFPASPVPGLLALFCVAAPPAPAQPPAAPAASVYPAPLRLDAPPGETFRFSAKSTWLDLRDVPDRAALPGLRRFLGAAKEVAPREVLLAGSPAALQKPLEALGLPPADVADLGPEGYAAACGPLALDGGPAVPALVIAASSARGFACALATLDQLGRATPVDGTAAGRSVELPRLKIVDRPALPLRGIAETGAGTPWPAAARAAMVGWGARHKLNTYLYAPSGDPWLREKWRDPLPPDAAAALRDLAAVCAAEQVDLVCGLRPDSIRPADEEDVRRLLALVDALRGVGIARFALFLDTAPKSGAEAPSHPEVALANRVWAELRQRDAQSRLWVVPAEPAGLDDTPSRQALRAGLDPAVGVLWSGPAAPASVVSDADAAKAAEQFGRKPILWDLYPANAAAPRRLFLGPLRGRAAGSAAPLAGYAAVPMALPEASKIALATAADFAWNPAAYDPERAWAAALAEAAGGPASPALPALRRLAVNAQGSSLQPVESPALAAVLKAYAEQGDAAAAALLAELDGLAKLRAAVDGSLPNKALAAELAPWTARLEWSARLAAGAVELARAVRTGKTDEAWVRRLAVAAARGKPPAAPAEVAGGLLDAVDARLVREADRWLGVGHAAIIASSLPAQEGFDRALAADGNPSTRFWSDQPPKAGDYVTLDLGAPRLVSRVDLVQGDAEHKDDVIHAGVLEVSADRNTWTEASKLGTDRVTRNFEPPVTARYLRARALQPQEQRVMVSEFSAYVLDEPTVQTVMPVPDDAPSLRAAIDRRVDTAFVTAGPVPAGAHLTIDLRSPRDVTFVSVLQDPAEAPAKARVKVSADGRAWEDAGEIAAPAARLDWSAAPRRAQYLRLEAAEATTGPVRIHEIGVNWK